MNLTFDDIEFKIFENQKIRNPDLENTIPSQHYYEQGQGGKFPYKINITRLNDQFNSRLRAKKNEVMKMAKEARERIRQRKHKEIQNIVTFLNKVKNEENSVKRTLKGNKRFLPEDNELECVKTVYLPKFKKGISFVKKKGEIKWKIGARINHSNYDNSDSIGKLSEYKKGTSNTDINREKLRKCFRNFSSFWVSFITRFFS